MGLEVSFSSRGNKNIKTAGENGQKIEENSPDHLLVSHRSTS
jgi:hypothetical protein